MAYDNDTNTSSSTNPDVGGYGGIGASRDLDFMFILPTGDVWQGETHQLEDGTWVTGSSLSKNSVVVAKVKLIPEFPNEGLVGRSEIFTQVFSKLKDWAVSSENSVSNINARLAKYEQTLSEMDSVLDLSFDKIIDFVRTTKMHKEEAGQGQINDFNLNFILDPANSTEANGRIESISYIHQESDEVYIYNGHVDTGLVNPGIDKLDTAALRLDMVSRTQAPVADSINSILLNSHLAPGFNGKIKVVLSQTTTISSIKLPLVEGATINGIILDGEELLEYTTVENTHRFRPMNINTIELLMTYISPVPFVSYITNDLQEDLLGNPQSDQIALDPPVYAKTSLDVGPLNITAISYKPEKEFELGPYQVKAGSLRSISINPQEVLDGYTNLSAHFNYKIEVAGSEYELSPWNREGNSPRIYYVNSGISDSVKTELASEHNVGFIDTNSPELEFKLKIKLMRPEAQHITPLLKGITVNYSTSLDGGYNG